ncbi:PRD domain-containing protein [Enterococcus sp. BWB1-3]|uniref:PRD domain-containing protein n=1 Tax=unclassified Enterococcus TaxID=2608891 RepID=UPI0019234709|nr:MULTISPECIES: PRD domain-containing protein [unclassified Enterococcus]MBL1230007.1 PRD domain-containing protein [Enterococcus sp. BWB1-3]MCB5952470.1 PRD domain-containing protein [Enterococcus sp. BWT-B8]
MQCIVKKINHNAVLIEENGIEKIAMGKGIGFSAKSGEIFDEKTADKFFTLDSKENIKMFSEMVSQIPLEYIEFAEEMISYIKMKINIPLNSSIYITLTDHIYFAIQRQKEDSQVTAIMLPEMKLLYPDEFQVATDIVKKLNQRYETELGNNEVGFITMHIINSELGEKNSLNGLKIMEITSFTLNLIEIESRMKLDKNSLSYNRLLIHLKFLAKRLIYQEVLSEEESFEFFDSSFKKSQYYKLAAKITDEIKKQYQVNMQENETAYLAIHIGRIK